MSDLPKGWPIPPEGPLDSPVLVLGRDPGEQEEVLGRPFVGPSGGVLNRALSAAGLSRKELLVTNVVNVRPKGNSWGEHSKEAVEAGRQSFVSLVQKYPKKVILALGEQALHTAVGYHPDSKQYAITEVRGYVHRGPYGLVVGSVHPSFVLRQWHPNYGLLVFDCKKVARLLRDGLQEKARSEVIVEDFASRILAAEDLQRAEVVGVDIETTSSGSISCIALAPSPEVGYVFRWLDIESWALLRKVLAEKHCVFHNGQFDTTILGRNNFPVRRGWDDTMLMWHALQPALAGKRQDKETGTRTEKSLRFLAGLLTDEPFWKDYDFASPDDQLRLCAKDARVTRELWEVLERELRNEV